MDVDNIHPKNSRQRWLKGIGIFCSCLLIVWLFLDRAIPPRINSKTFNELPWRREGSGWVADYAGDVFKLSDKIQKEAGSEMQFCTSIDSTDGYSNGYAYKYFVLIAFFEQHGGKMSVRAKWIWQGTSRY